MVDKKLNTETLSPTKYFHFLHQSNRFIDSWASYTISHFLSAYINIVSYKRKKLKHIVKRSVIQSSIEYIILFHFSRLANFSVVINPRLSLNRFEIFPKGRNMMRCLHRVCKFHFPYLAILFFFLSVLSPHCMK